MTGMWQVNTDTLVGTPTSAPITSKINPTEVTLQQHSYLCGKKPLYEDHVKSSWAQLITPSQNFVEVRWRSVSRSTSLGKRCTSYNAPPTSPKRAADRWSLRNFLLRSSLFMVGKAQKSHAARSELNSVFGLEKVYRWNPIRTSAIQSRSHPMRFLGFSNYEKGVPRQEISKWSEVKWSGWSVVRNALLAKGGASKKRPSPHLHKVRTWSNESTNFANDPRIIDLSMTRN
jgi:hypothetical protein